MSTHYAIYRRNKVFVNDDPQRRCYNGCYFRSHYEWGPWERLESTKWLKPGADINERLKFWQELNAYAVRQRGEDAMAEYKIVEEQEEQPA